MLGGADDAASLGLVLDAIHACDESERLFRFGHVARVEEVSARVREATAASSLAFADEWVVSAIVVAENGAGGVLEHVDGGIAAAQEIEAITGQGMSDESP